MPSAKYLFPRLPTSVASAIAQAVRAADLQRVPKGQYFHDSAVYGATGGVRAPKEVLIVIAEGLERVARRHGYPDRRPSRVEARRFDVEAAQILYEQMDITPHEASQAGVWQFCTCVLAPGIVKWRFPGVRGETPAARFLGGVRNTFGRLWWRAYLLSNEGDGSPYRLLEALNEDELVQIMERPTIAGCNLLAKQVATTFLTTLGASHISAPEVHKRMFLMREAMKRVMRILPIVSVELLADHLITPLLNAQFLEAVRCIQRGSKLVLAEPGDYLS